MRLWSPELLPYLPELQFKGQYRELVSIMHDWRDKGSTNHILINRVMMYPKEELVKYFMFYNKVYEERFRKKVSKEIWNEFVDFGGGNVYDIDANCHNIYHGWLDSPQYYKVQCYNLYEKHVFGVGKSRITDYQWDTFVEGYKKVT